MATTDSPVGDLAKGVYDALLEAVTTKVLPDLARAVRDAVMDEVRPLLARAEDRAAAAERCVSMAGEVFARSFTSLADLLKAMPVPVVTLPEAAIRVEVSQPPPPNVVVPEGAIRVVQEAPVVHLPEKSIVVQVTQAPAPPVVIGEKAFSVQVAPPVFSPRIEVASPEVHVSVPEKAIKVEVPPRKVTSVKSIVYSPQTGRPEKVVEEATEE